jgi:hypothetical protein
MSHAISRLSYGKDVAGVLTQQGKRCGGVTQVNCPIHTRPRRNGFRVGIFSGIRRARSGSVRMGSTFARNERHGDSQAPAYACQSLTLQGFCGMSLDSLHNTAPTLAPFADLARAALGGGEGVAVPRGPTSSLFIPPLTKFSHCPRL